MSDTMGCVRNGMGLLESVLARKERWGGEAWWCVCVLGGGEGRREMRFDRIGGGAVSHSGCALAYWEFASSLCIILLGLWPSSPYMVSTAPRAHEEVVVITCWWQRCLEHGVFVTRAGGNADLE